MKEIHGVGCESCGGTHHSQLDCPAFKRIPNGPDIHQHQWQVDGGMKVNHTVDVFCLCGVWKNIELKEELA